MSDFILFLMKAVIAMVSVTIFKGLIHRAELGINTKEREKKIIEAFATLMVCLLVIL